MASFRALKAATSYIVGLCALAAGGCETSFGQPCTIPTSHEFRQACEAASKPPGKEDAGVNDIRESSAASCAIKNYAGCATRICLVYRDSSPFCSEQCTTDSDCPGSALCRPVLGDDPTLCSNADDPFSSECYCVKESMTEPSEPANFTPDNVMGDSGPAIGGEGDAVSPLP